MAVPSIQSRRRTVEHVHQCRWLVFFATVVLAAVLGRQVWQYAAGPAGDKDCSPVAPRPIAGTLVINDVSCLNPTPITGVVSVKTEDDIRQALALGRDKSGTRVHQHVLQQVRATDSPV
jgi:hypothetical protein